jgi:hypothetical protein
MMQLQLHAATARALFDWDPIYIWLIRATPLAAGCLDEILAKFQLAGVEFVGLEEAMAGPLNHSTGIKIRRLELCYLCRHDYEIPPVTSMVRPVTKSASCEAKKAITRA